MKDKYIDQYGIDSLPHIKEAVAAKCDVFVTINQSVLGDRKELEKKFGIKIATPEEIIKKDEI